MQLFDKVLLIFIKNKPTKTTNYESFQKNKIKR